MYIRKELYWKNQKHALHSLKTLYLFQNPLLLRHFPSALIQLTKVNLYK